MTPEERLEDLFLAEATPLDQRMIIRDCLRAARAQALEEAARVVEGLFSQHAAQQMPTILRDDQIAAAIRALKDVANP